MPVTVPLVPPTDAREPLNDQVPPVIELVSVEEAPMQALAIPAGAGGAGLIVTKVPAVHPDGTV
jgi:hypothetical protein